MPAQHFEIIPLEILLARAQALRQSGWRLVQIGATRLPDKLELTYSFDRANELANLRFEVHAQGARVPSISSVYWSAFLYENEMHDLFNVQVDGIAVDFQGNLYKTTVKFPFGSTKVPAVKPAVPPQTVVAARKPAPELVSAKA